MFKPYLNETQRTIDLDHEQLIVFEDRAGTRVQVLYGGLWLTEERNLDDRFAGAGQWLRVEHGGRAVAESLGASRVRIVEAVPRVMAAWRNAARAWWPHRRELATKSLVVAMALLVGIGLPELLARSFQGTPGVDSSAAQYFLGAVRAAASPGMSVRAPTASAA